MKHIDKHTGIHATFESLGSNDAKLGDAIPVFDPLTDFNSHSGEVILKATAKPLDDPESVKWIEEHKGHLLPPKYADDLVAQAFIENNVTARGRVLTTYGQQRADELARSYGLKSIADTRKGTRPAAAGPNAPKKPTDRRNPWLKAAWSITEQGRIVRQLGEQKAAQIAAAAGCRIGSVRPNPAYN